MLEHRSTGHVCLISHPYDDSSATYLGTAILTILCLRHLFATTSEQEYTLNRPPPCETNRSQIQGMEISAGQVRARTQSHTRSYFHGRLIQKFNFPRAQNGKWPVLSTNSNLDMVS